MTDRPTSDRPIAQLSELVRNLPNSRPDLVPDFAAFRPCSRSPNSRSRSLFTYVRLPQTLCLMPRTITAMCMPHHFHLLYSTLYIAAPSAKGIPRLVFFGFPFARCAILTFFSIAQYNFGFPFASTIALCFEGCPYSKTSLTRDPTTTTKPARVLYTVFA